MQNALFKLRSNSVYFNLATEELLVNKFANTEEECALLYRNKPCVVIGKNQITPWEVDFDYINSNRIELIRRQSGGGAVYHDLDCINISFIKNRKGFDNLKNSKRIAEILSNIFDVDLFSVTPKGDILLDNKKISGSAYMFCKNKVVHHMTLLVNSDLEKLKKSLYGMRKDDRFKVEGAFINSREMETTNLKEYFNIGTSVLWNALGMIIANEFNYKELDEEFILKKLDVHELKDVVTKYRTFEYLHGRPNFKISFQNNRLEFQDGILIKNLGDVRLDSLVGRKVNEINFKSLIVDSI